MVPSPLLLGLFCHFCGSLYCRVEIFHVKSIAKPVIFLENSPSLFTPLYKNHLTQQLLPAGTIQRAAPLTLLAFVYYYRSLGKWYHRLFNKRIFLPSYQKLTSKDLAIHELYVIEISTCNRLVNTINLRWSNFTHSKILIFCSDML